VRRLVRVAALGDPRPRASLAATSSFAIVRSLLVGRGIPSKLHGSCHQPPASGGSATGIGAIWAALLARRQAQLTERSLEEQNERARLTLEFDLFSRIGERLESPHWLNTRRAAAEYLLENAFEGNEVVEVTALNTAVWEVCNLFEEIGNC
jgi:hypothetical protein